MRWRIKIILWAIFSAIFTLLGEIFILLKRYRIAEGLYNLKLKIWPARRAEILSDLGSLYERSGNLKKAAEFYEEACKLEPNEGFHYIILGDVYEKQNKIELAIENYEKGLHIGTNFGKEFRNTIQSKINKLKKKGE